MNQDVSVVFPAYNRSAFVPLVVESILAQTHPVSEIIIVDDGSSDDTAEVIEREIREKAAWREKVRYIYQSNQGQCAALNAAIAKASSPWIAFGAHDDLWLPWKLEWQFRALDHFGESYGLCFTDAYFVNNPYMKTTTFKWAGQQDGQALGVVEDPARIIAQGKLPMWLQTVIVRADLVQKVGGMDPELRYSEDHEFLFRLALATKFCFVSMPMVLIDRSPADHRHQGAALDWHKEEFRLRADQYRFEKQLKLGRELPAATQAAIRRSLREIHSAWANWHLHQGSYPEALASVSTAAGYDLTLGVALKWLLMRLSPALLKWILNYRDKADVLRHDRASWLTHDKPAVM